MIVASSPVSREVQTARPAVRRVGKGPGADQARDGVRLAPLHAAEFFAGIGLVRRSLEQSDVRVVFANDIDSTKRSMYVANFGDADFVLGDIANVSAEQIPDIDLATASFPCTDLSLAGNRAGLDGAESGAFWLFTDLLERMGERRPPVILLENVGGLGTSRGGEDLRDALSRLNELGYSCDLVQLNAARWVPQSRLRVFVIGSLKAPTQLGDWGPDELRPAWITRFVERNSDLRMSPAHLTLPDPVQTSLSSCIERLSPADQRWWDAERMAKFVESLSDIQAARLGALRNSERDTWRTAYRRTRAGKPTWEIRSDDISGCLRTARGGSSRQVLVEMRSGQMRVRWMTAREYAALMGAPSHVIDVVSENQALFGLGDAVCVPAMSWLVQTYLVPLATQGLVGHQSMVA
jgi:DNA (cytosine-5)-methyltransferase 1